MSWDIERCENETGHAQVKNSHFCRCTHVMYDSPQPAAERMPAMDGMTEDMRDMRDARRLRELLYQAIVELQYVQDAENHSLCASAKGQWIVEEGMNLLGVKDLSRESLTDKF